MRRIWDEYGLSIALALMFFASLVLQTWMGWNAFAAEQRSHDETPEAFGESGYVWDWGQATFENWQSEFLQLLTFVVLTRSSSIATATSRRIRITTPKPPCAASRPRSMHCKPSWKRNERQEPHARTRA